MRIHHGWTDIPDTARGASVAMGNFDGLHIGHQSVIDLARRPPASSRGQLGIVTFEPHPRQVFAPEAAPFRLMNAEARANRLARLGIQELFELPFTAEMAGMDPQVFVAQVLGGLGVAHVVVGADFRFGKGRTGEAQDLKRLAEAQGIAVTIAPLVARGGVEVSSTAIRVALAEGRPRDAADMLGHWHRIEGEVVHGEKRGRQLGYPTANMSVQGLHLPKLGVYAVKVDILTGPQAGAHIGAASLGVRPQFGGTVPNLETFLFDFTGDLYGQHLSVALVDYLRPEMKFDGLQGLLDQMAADCDRARAILS
ncbi:bifunctional riboflavin kinase/FAD synthetase [Rhodobacter sp. KR11]|uniref:bifunctional riboflavin kinase/FAD synthetase n=1 Tax=Rhodobacter sp. KR11 TaxID=2974588 RepID=UPI0022229984|nr:bifunctional riboflavin kinase/FAD synthetase [Rhodobacter sp. KR11]MCW1918697.1 bifunctional riboflavin kinase/FAD synthetase [Rhodobacter sp. KR11]